MTAGRPTDYDPSICGDIPEMFRNGESKAEVAAALGIARSTFSLWEQKHEEFSAAVKRGVDLSVAWWLREGRMSLRDRDFSYTGWYMNMKNRHGWRDKQDITTDGTKIETPHVTITHVEPGKATDS